MRLHDLVKDRLLSWLLAGSAVAVTVMAAVALWRLLGAEAMPRRDPAAAPARTAAPARAEATRLDDALRRRLAALPRLHGEALRAGSLEGRVVLVTFFASWCGPCRVELQHLKELRAAYRGFGVEVVAVNRFETFDDLSDHRRLAAYLERLDPAFPVVKGDDAVARAFGGIERIPTLFVFDRQGRPATRFVNARGDGQAAPTLQSLAERIGPLL